MVAQIRVRGGSTPTLKGCGFAKRQVIDPSNPRADFEQLPADARSKLLGMLCQSGVESPEWWWDVLTGEGDPLYLGLEPLS